MLAFEVVSLCDLTCSLIEANEDALVVKKEGGTRCDGAQVLIYRVALERVEAAWSVQLESPWITGERFVPFVPSIIQEKRASETS